MTQLDDDRLLRPPLRDRLGNMSFLGLMTLARTLPYPKRIAMMGWFFAYVLAPIAGWRKRIRHNLALARPDLDPSMVKRLTRSVPDNAGRSMAETYSGAEFIAHVRANSPVTGPGLPELQAAADAGRPVIIASSHFGNYDAMRAALMGRGWTVGALYRPMNNHAFNEHYTEAITTIGEPLFPRGRAGLSGMIKFLKAGGWLAIGFDQYNGSGADLRFFGLRTKTVLTPAELALRYDALLIPINAIRQDNGQDFRIDIGPPVPHSSPEAMMQQLNDHLEQLVRTHMGQWLWAHRRWKDHN